MRKAKTVATQLASKPADFDTLAAKVVRHPELLKEVFEGMDAQAARVKYGCLKLLRLISEKEPRVLYPEIDRFIQLMDSENTIFKWGAIIIIGNLAAVDSQKKIDAILNHYLKPISGRVMITAANVIEGAARIARAKPYLADRLARAMLKVEAATYQTEECRNVAVGHAVESFDEAFENIKRQQPVVEFVRRQLCNRRNAVRRKAEKFLKRHCQLA
jgi:hypothetical protein